jgi:hypothetical protein
VPLPAAKELRSMNCPRACLIATIVAVSAIAATTIASTGSTAQSKKDSLKPGTDPEHARLTAMCGTWPGDTWHQRTVIQPLLADAMIATSYLSFGKVPKWKAVEIKYTRSPK